MLGIVVIFIAVNVDILNRPRPVVFAIDHVIVIPKIKNVVVFGYSDIEISDVIAVVIVDVNNNVLNVVVDVDTGDVIVAIFYHPLHYVINIDDIINVFLHHLVRNYDSIPTTRSGDNALYSSSR